MIKRIIALLLALCCWQGGALADGVQLRFTMEESEVLSEGALRALGQWLEQAYLVLDTAQDKQLSALYYDDAPLIVAAADAQSAVLTAEGLTVPVERTDFSLQEIISQALDKAQMLGQALSVYEKSAKATAELGGVVKAKTQLSYALSKEQWAEIWPQVCDILGERFAAYTMESKGTLRRYFDAEGSEIGAYFYAEKVRVGENDVREVRLEYGYQQAKGLYLSFRCPNKNETRNTRILLTAKRTERTDRISYAVNGDIRLKHAAGQDTLLIESTLKEQEGVFSGKATLNYTQKRGEQSVKHALTIKPEVALGSLLGVIKIAYDRAGQNVATGTLALSAAQAGEISIPAVNASQEQLTEALARRLVYSLLDIAPEDRLELMYYLNRSLFLTGDEKEIYLMYDPEFMVMEEPEE